MMIHRHLSPFPLMLFLLLAGTAEAGAGRPTHVQAWKLSTRAAWPPAREGARLIFRTGSSLAAHALDSGQKVWTRRVNGLVSGPRVMAALGGKIFALSRKGVHVFDGESGKPLTLKKIKKTRSLIVSSGSVYVSTAREVYRLDETGKVVLSRAKKIGGDLEAASGGVVVLHTERKDPRTRKRAKRLEVMDLSSGEVLYAFKLLPRGGHRVIHLDGRRLIFIDYSKKDSKGKNSKKLYYTEVNYRKKQKIRDLALSDKYAAEESDQVWVTRGGKGTLYLSSHGKPGAPSTLLAYDPVKRKTLWERVGEVASPGLLLHNKLLWTVTSGGGKSPSRLTTYDPSRGKTRSRVVLDGPGVGRVLAMGDRVLVRTRRSVFCFAPGDFGKNYQTGEKVDAGAPKNSKQKQMDAGVAPAVDSTRHPAPPAAKDPPSGTPRPPAVATGLKPRPLPRRPGWHAYSDRVTGFSIKMPDTWRLDRGRLRRLSGVRSVIPFARIKKARQRQIYLGTLQVLTWEAAGRDASALWQSVYSQRRRLNPDLKVTKVYRLLNVGGQGVGGVLAEYQFRGPKGRMVKLRSICVVNHDVAFELRAWASPRRPRILWREIEQIGASFSPALR